MLVAASPAGGPRTSVQLTQGWTLLNGCASHNCYGSAPCLLTENTTREPAATERSSLMMAFECTSNHLGSIMRSSRMGNSRASARNVIDWIEATLKCRHSECYQGWNAKTKRYVEDRRVNIAFDHFVVVLQFRLRGNGLKATLSLASRQTKGHRVGYISRHGGTETTAWPS